MSRHIPPCIYYRMGGAANIHPNVIEGTFPCGTPVEQDGVTAACTYEAVVENFRIVQRLGTCPLKTVVDGLDNIAHPSPLPHISNV